MHRLVPTTTALALAFTLPLSFAPSSASAEDDEVQRRSKLEGQPAVRNRKLLVKKRLELTPLFQSSINADFKHTVGFGAKVEYHLTDMFSIGAVGTFGLGFNTGLTNRIVETLPETSPGDGDPTPTRSQYEQHLNEIGLLGAAYASITPWYGKLAAFGKFDLNFDFYFQGGLAIASLSNEGCPSCTDTMPGGDPDNFIPGDNNPNNDPALNDGTKLGVYLGGGIHVFLSDMIALDLTVRDYLFSDNPSGLDFNADLAVKDDDNRFLNHLFFGVGVSIFLPSKVVRTP